jgi:hypothetical protein
MTTPDDNPDDTHTTTPDDNPHDNTRWQPTSGVVIRGCHLGLSSRVVI